MVIKSLCMNVLLVVPLLLGLGAPTMAQDIRTAGALAFSPDGILFVGDNVGGAIYAFDVGKGTAPEKPTPVDVDNVPLIGWFSMDWNTSVIRRRTIRSGGHSPHK